MDPKLMLKLAVLNNRLHALEKVFLSVHPEKKQELEEAFMKFMGEQLREHHRDQLSEERYKDLLTKNKDLETQIKALEEKKLAKDPNYSNRERGG